MQWQMLSIGAHSSYVNTHKGWSLWCHDGIHGNHTQLDYAKLTNGHHITFHLHALNCTKLSINWQYNSFHVDFNSIVMYQC